MDDYSYFFDVYWEEFSLWWVVVILRDCDYEVEYVILGWCFMFDVVLDKFDVKYLGIFECDVWFYIRIG